MQEMQVQSLGQVDPLEEKMQPPPVFFRQKYWSGLPCPPPGDLPNAGIKPVPLESLALAGEFFTTSAIWEAQC